MIFRASANPGGIWVSRLSREKGESRLPSAAELPGLVPCSPARLPAWLRPHLQDFSLEGLVPQVTSPPDAVALKAGLLQIHDDLDASHELSQSIEGEGRQAAGDYWHAITHRREPDYSNAKYWFRRVGSHPIFEPLAKAADSLLSEAPPLRQKLLPKGHWDAFAFIDFCQECQRDGDSRLTEIAKQIQWQEMQLLLEQTYRDAVE